MSNTQSEPEEAIIEEEIAGTATPRSQPPPAAKPRNACKLQRILSIYRARMLIPTGEHSLGVNGTKTQSSTNIETGLDGEQSIQPS
jgi:HD superfamily phosphodiesterase